MNGVRFFLLLVLIGNLHLFHSFGFSTAAQAINPVMMTHTNSPFNETFFYDDLPTAEQVAAWSALPGERDYVFKMGFPTPDQLLILAPLQGVKTLKVELQQYPKPNHEEAWKLLKGRFGKKLELVIFGLALPNEAQIDTLNSIAPDKIIFVLIEIPFLYETEKLKRLEVTNYSFTMAGPRYPLDPFTEGPAFQVLPKDLTLSFISKSWPDQYNRKFFNEIPQPIKIRVTQTMPSASALAEINAIQRLTAIHLEWDGEVKDSFWEKLPQVPLKWTIRDWIPSPKSLKGFAAAKNESRPVELILDRDEPLSGNDLRNILESKLPVQWIHRAP